MSPSYLSPSSCSLHVQSFVQAREARTKLFKRYTRTFVCILACVYFCCLFCCCRHLLVRCTCKVSCKPGRHAQNCSRGTQEPSFAYLRVYISAVYFAVRSTHDPFYTEMSGRTLAKCPQDTPVRGRGVYSYGRIHGIHRRL